MALRVKNALVCSVAVLGTPAAAAAAQQRSIDLPSQDAAKAIPEFARQENIVIVAPVSQLHGIKTPAVKGYMDVRVALDRLLVGTGLEIAENSGGTVILRRAATAAPDPEPADQPSTEAVTVSASRVIRDGFEAPTPTQVLGADDIAAQAQDNIYSAVTQLPSLMGSLGVAANTGGTSSGNNHISSFGMRGLGPIRTLTLLDGQRVVPANVSGINDVSEFPQLLIQRVDVVTGGASASWGSDAVAGVVNFITDKKFVGFKANLQGGISTYGDDANVLVQMAAGTTFASGRGHIELSAEYDLEGGIPPGDFGIGYGPGGRTWSNSTALLKYGLTSTLAGLPQYVVAANAQDFQLAKYGIITTGPLQGVAFGANGSPYPFTYGVGPNGLPGTPSKTSSGAVNNCLSPWCIGGDTSGSITTGTTLIDSLTRADLYGRISYDLTPTTNIWATVNLAETHGGSVPSGGYWYSNLTIRCDNAFLPASIVTACGNNNISNFGFGTDNASIPGHRFVRSVRNQRRFVVGADGAFSILGKDWTWGSYYQHGENDTNIKVHIPLNPYFNAAVDAVTGPGGTIVCRSTIAQVEGCVPFNPFGNIVPTQAAIDWMMGGKHASRGIGPTQLTHQKQDVFSLNANGEPLSSWAGPISVAFGYEYRNEAYDVTGDPASTGDAGDALLSSLGSNWYGGNFQNGAGNYHVSEGFLETVVPLLNSGDWGKVDLDLGGRATGYSTSGYVNTWKVGLTWQTPIEGVRFRTLQSRDIRAPNLGELFAAQLVVASNGTNDFTKTAVQFQAVTAGNPSLKPEKAQTTELGFVYQPDWLPGFNASVDYYRIDVRGQIGALTQQNIIDLCFQGFTPQCSNIITTPPGAPVATSVWRQVVAQSFNLASTVTDGFDLEASYRFNLEGWGLPGEFALRSLATHVSKFIQTTGVPGTIAEDLAGENSGAIPHWKLFASQSYNADRWSVTVSENFISDGVLNRNYIQCTSGCPLPTATQPTINDNRIPGAFYVNVGATYNIDEHWQLFGRIDNVGNENPAQIANPVPTNLNGVNGVLYDVIGRMYRAGIRLNIQ